MADLMDKVASLAKRRGFIYQGSEIYGGLANTYDYGPMGVELLRNIKNLWWEHFVTRRADMYGLDSNILMSPKVWEASGHTANFTDVVLDCKKCNSRTRADHLIEDYFTEKGEEKKVEGLSEKALAEIINKEEIPCPSCGKHKWTDPRRFNLLFDTEIGIVSGKKSKAFLRGEIAQGMFVNFKNVLDTQSPKLPFGLAQSGSVFRNEITLGKLTYRTLQFNLSEFEYFFDPETTKWVKLFDYWKEEMWKWAINLLGIDEKNLRWRPHTDEERSHYSKRTEDVEYKYPWGFKELYGLAYRTDFDLKNHMERSGVDMRYTDPVSGKKFIPHVVEPTFGMDRSLLAILFDGYTEEKGDEKERVFLKIRPQLAPYKLAVFPLLANKEGLVDKAKGIFENLEKQFNCAWDERGNIGKRYYAQDEIGTPWCLTVDFQTLEDGTVTIRDRDTAIQERVSVDKLTEYIQNGLSYSK
jgi:glycyl-tRNA synthetase